MTAIRAWLQPDTRTRRVLLGVALYLVCTAVFAAVAGPSRLTEHTPYNHYALLAEAWLHGRQDLANGPPPYSGNNDFASFQGKTYISFPPFPAVLMLPFVALAGGAENFRDGQFVILLAGLAPAFLFLVLEKLRRTGRSDRSEGDNVFLSAIMALGTVYFFTAVEGTVWFAAIVVNVALMGLYALFALDAERPALAGTMLGLVFATRVTPILAAPLFALEAVRVTCRGGLPADGSVVDRIRTMTSRTDVKALLGKLAAFALPILVIGGACAWSNFSRFHNLSFGHEYLSVAWRGRMAKWGIFSYHYLAKNLGCMLTILPWLQPNGTRVSWFDMSGAAPFQINEHGLALWFTVPVYFWLFRPHARGWLHYALLLSALGPILADLLYQNTGWRQFGYRFSNDYVVFLFMLLAIGGGRFGLLFRSAALWGVVINLFGAITFDRGDVRFDRFYFRDGSQVIVYQPD